MIPTPLRPGHMSLARLLLIALPTFAGCPLASPQPVHCLLSLPADIWSIWCRLSPPAAFCSARWRLFSAGCPLLVQRLLCPSPTVLCHRHLPCTPPSPLCRYPLTGIDTTLLPTSGSPYRIILSDVTGDKWGSGVDMLCLLSRGSRLRTHEVRDPVGARSGDDRIYTVYHDILDGNQESR